jgi:Tfp pilus assembly pilus retraction ATPase PilT
VETVMTNRPSSGTAHFAKVNAEEVDGGFAWGDLHLRNAVRAFGQIVTSIRARHRRLAREVLARKVIAVASPAWHRSVNFDCRTLE